MLLLLLFDALCALLCVVQMRGMWPPFIGRDEGVLGNMLDPIWKEQADLKPSFRYIEPGNHLDTDVGQGDMCQSTKARFKWVRLGCGRTQGVAVPWLARLTTALLWWAPGWAWTSTTSVLSPISFV